eukprot:gene3356-3632_t
MIDPHWESMGQAAVGHPSLVRQTTLLQAPLDYTSIVLELARQVLQLRAAQSANGQGPSTSQQTAELQQLLSLAAILSKLQPAPQPAYPLPRAAAVALQSQASGHPATAAPKTAEARQQPTLQDWQPSAVDSTASQPLLAKATDGRWLTGQLQTVDAQVQINATSAQHTAVQQLISNLVGQPDKQQLFNDNEHPQTQLQPQQNITNSTSDARRAATSPDMPMPLPRSQDIIEIAVPEADLPPSQAWESYCCPDNYSCLKISDWFYQCKPDQGASRKLRI